MHSRCTYSLYELAKYLSENNITHKLLLSPGTLIANQRHELVLAAKEWRATHVMFIDSDIVFRPEHVHDLLKFNKAVVGAAYSKRIEPIIPTVWHKIDDWNSYVKFDELTESHIKVACMALGFCLIRTDVFSQINLPWFILGYNNGSYTGEDIEFFRKCGESNIPIWLDVKTSLEISHLGIKEFKIFDDIVVNIAT
jgi:hypothetical protein